MFPPNTLFDCHEQGKPYNGGTREKVTGREPAHRCEVNRKRCRDREKEIGREKDIVKMGSAT